MTHAGNVLFLVTLTFDPEINRFPRDSCWNISTLRLVILAASMFEISCRKTDRQTNRWTYTRRRKPTHVTVVGMGSYCVTQPYSQISRCCDARLFSRSTARSRARPIQLVVFWRQYLTCTCRGHQAEICGWVKGPVQNDVMHYAYYD